MINKIVAEYLDGNIIDLVFDYKENNIYTMTIFYERDDIYKYEYQVIVDENRKSVTFNFHICRCQHEVIKLSKNSEFDKKLLQYI